MADREDLVQVELFDRIDHPRGVSLFAGHAGALQFIRRVSAGDSTAGPVWSDACRSDHVQNAGGEAEQEEHDKSEGRCRQQAVEAPAKQRTDEDAGDQFGRQPQSTRHGRSPGCSVTAADSRLISPDLSAVAKFGQPLVETSEPCGKRSLIGRLIAIPVSAAVVRAIRHDVETRRVAASCRK